MKRFQLIAAIVFVFSTLALAQPATQKAGGDVKAAPAPIGTEPIDLAKAMQAAHGGDKLKAVRSMVTKGSLEMTVMGQFTLPGAFSIAFSGDKYFFNLETPQQSLKQVFNGQRTYTSVEGIYLPPAAAIGFPVLAHVGDEGYVVSALDPKKKGKGFRITTPDGYYTDFFMDEKTRQLKSFDSAYDMGGGRMVSTSMTFDSFEMVDGVLVPKKFSQRIDMGQITGYANFNAKTITVNQKIDDSAFSLGN